MDEPELDVVNQEVFSAPDAGDQLRSSCSMDSFFDEIFKDTHACTHTHTCNPPGPDLSHSHTCYHVHTKIMSAPADETAESTEKSSLKKRPFGNREAVRKYREKKKAHTASLEDENRQLRDENQQLLKKLHSIAPLEAENMRLKCLLVDLRGRIDGEIGSFPYQKPAKEGVELVSNATQLNMPGGAHILNSCNLRCDDQLYCPRPGMQQNGAVEDGVLDGQGFGCELGTAPCLQGSANESKRFLGCERGNVLPAVCTSSANGRKGVRSVTDLTFVGDGLGGLSGIK